ncbi:MAG: hypothetical protein Q8M26_06850 [Pseudolabrys sp.]|nr:hypothetical protein [Pseudolabrys sp.]
MIDSPSARIADRLTAYARLCRQIAGASWDEDTARALEAMAADCYRAAARARAL